MPNETRQVKCCKHKLSSSPSMLHWDSRSFLSDASN
uniref:Uncharacterized protein n=1 Tax=Arundo donax TaxID=35708 RepID=A0A0A9E7Q5_ARUDO